jgi:hypothetical protein
MNLPELPALPSECAIAFKEWAVVCAALAAGRQTIILRKGGIHEGRDGFRVQHNNFWLLPTNFHQQSDHLAAGADDLLTQVQTEQPPSGEFHLRQFAYVQQVIELGSEAQALALEGLHLWSEKTVRERFHYRQPGLFLLIVRTYQRTTPQVVEEQPSMAGCKTWVDLPATISTGGLAPVLSDSDFESRWKEVVARLS